MSEDAEKKSHDSEHHAEPEANPPTKRPYDKPTYRHEKVFERMALACGKVGTLFQCQFNRKTS